MSRNYFSWEEEEAYKQGKRDEEYRHTDFDHDRFAYDGVDRAYYDGRKDEKDEEDRQESQRREEEQQREAEEELRLERDRQEEQEYLDMLADAERQEIERISEDADRQVVSDFDALMREDMQSQDDETPCSEEDLFRQIIDDERNDLDI